MSKFKIGDIIIVHSSSKRYPKAKIGLTGIVVTVVDAGVNVEIGVDFGRSFDGHTINGRLDVQNGYYVPMSIISLIDEENE